MEKVLYFVNISPLLEQNCAVLLHSRSVTIEKTVVKKVKSILRGHFPEHMGHNPNKYFDESKYRATALPNSN